MSSAKTFLVTGCASGIGKHLTEELVRRGHRVCATALQMDVLASIAREGNWPDDRVMMRQLDVREPESWDRVVAEAVAKFGGIDVLLNVAGFLQPGWLHKITPADVHRHFDVNTKGMIFGTMAASKPMTAQGSGHIVNIASLAAVTPVSGISLYSASKYAIRSFSLSVAGELKSKGVAITVVCPDGVATPMLEREKSYEESALVFSAPRILTVEEVTETVLGRVLEKKPLEVFMPASRGWLGRLGDVFPGLHLRLEPVFRRIGQAKMARLVPPA